MTSASGIGAEPVLCARPIGHHESGTLALARQHAFMAGGVDPRETVALRQEHIEGTGAVAANVGGSGAASQMGAT